MIKKMEEQAQGGGSSDGKAGKASKQNKSGAPAGDSQVKGNTSAGDVDKKRMKPGAVWGNLDDKERVKVKDLISRDFPAYYRQAIEAYFKKLAERDAK